jgi:hypothetical protein
MDSKNELIINQNIVMSWIDDPMIKKNYTNEQLFAILDKLDSDIPYHQLGRGIINNEIINRNIDYKQNLKTAIDNSLHDELLIGPLDDKTGLRNRNGERLREQVNRMNNILNSDIGKNSLIGVAFFIWAKDQPFFENKLVCKKVDGFRQDLINGDCELIFTLNILNRYIKSLNLDGFNVKNTQKNIKQLMDTEDVRWNASLMVSGIDIKRKKKIKN